MKRRTFIKAGVTAAAIAPFGGSAAGGSAPRLRAGFSRLAGSARKAGSAQ